MISYIYIEPSEEGVASVTKQIASGIKEIPPEVRGPVKGIVIGEHMKNKESLLSGLVDELLIVEAPPGNEYNMEAISNILAAILKENGPGVLFMGFTHQGMELAPVIGWRMGIPVVTSCVGLDWTDKQAVIKRNIFSGKLLLTATVNMEQGAVISVQKGAWQDTTGKDADTKCELKSVAIPWDDAWSARKTEYISIFEESLEGKEDITKAEILVSVGRGIGGADNVPMAKQLADDLGGMLACSRPVVDLGWLPAYRQVGISGKTVTPVVYLALGISGQNNHVMGMDGSSIIIAVNTDESAPIFELAKYGIIEDVLDFIPELSEQAKAGK